LGACSARPLFLYSKIPRHDLTDASLACRIDRTACRSIGGALQGCTGCWMEITVRRIDRRGVGGIGGALYRSADRSKHRRSFRWIGEASYRSAERCADRRPVVRIGGLSYRSAGGDKDRRLAGCIRDPSYGSAECWIDIRSGDRSARRCIDRRGSLPPGPPGEEGEKQARIQSMAIRPRPTVVPLPTWRISAVRRRGAKGVRSPSRWRVPRRPPRVTLRCWRLL